MNLVNDVIDENDISELIGWLSQSPIPRLTKGELTLEFEEKWSNKLGVEYSVFVNSGSSAILLSLVSLSYSNRLKNKKIIVPNLSWSTDVSCPILLGYDVKLVDCNLEDLSVDLNRLEQLFIDESPSVFLLVSVLGFVPRMDDIVFLCEKYGVILLEDGCESLGSKYKESYLGTFGYASMFSFYFGHHLSTIEGGVVSTNDRDFYNILLSIRSHGWDRDLDIRDQLEWRNEWEIDEFSSLYSFYYPGLNLRSTDLQAFIGIKQLDKMDEICFRRNQNFLLYGDSITNNLFNGKQRNGDFISSFAYPVLVKNRNEIVKRMGDHNIEIRPLIAGSMSNQPFVKNSIPVESKKEYPNCTVVDNFGFYLPNNPELTDAEIILISGIINE